MRRAQAPRGQALVEAVLGILLFVSILAFGIHFAEVGWLSLKAQEAAASAVFDGTARRIQTLEGLVNPGGLLGGSHSLERVAEGQYRDFDGTSDVRAGATVTQVFTRGQRLSVNCRDARLSFPATPTVAAVYRDVGSVQCTASARLTAFHFPVHFLDERAQSGLFQTPNGSTTPIDVCAVGRARGGRCQGELAVLLNDWGMSSDHNGENRDCLLSSCRNPSYKRAVQSMYAPLGSVGVSLATFSAGFSPVDPAAFYMSYSGIEHDYEDGLPGHTADPALYPYKTGGPGAGLLENHSDTGHACFLGMPGPGCN